jgi:hypothetical protein
MAGETLLQYATKIQAARLGNGEGGAPSAHGALMREED